MKLRRPTIADYKFVAECYSDWPLSSLGPMKEQRAIDNVRKWESRTDCEQVMIGVTDKPVGLIMYQQGGPYGLLSSVYQIAVHPDHRGVGYATGIWRALKEHLVSRGTKVCRFDALPGPVADKVMRGDFIKIGESTGAQTGLPVVIGMVTADMDI